MRIITALGLALVLVLLAPASAFAREPVWHNPKGYSRPPEIVCKHKDHYHSSKAQVRRCYGPTITYYLKGWGIYSRYNYERAVAVILGESHGRWTARSGKHFGVVQFNEDWVSKVGSKNFVNPKDRFTKKDWRGDPRKSIRLMTKSIAEDRNNWYDHWKATAFA